MRAGDKAIRSGEKDGSDGDSSEWNERNGSSDRVGSARKVVFGKQASR